MVCARGSMHACLPVRVVLGDGRDDIFDNHNQKTAKVLLFLLREVGVYLCRPECRLV